MFLVLLRRDRAYLCVAELLKQACLVYKFGDVANYLRVG